MNQDETFPDSWLDGAMNRALEADQDAFLSVAESRREAEELLLEARRQAASIEARADRRMATVQKERAKVLRRQLETLQRHHRRAALFKEAGEERFDTPAWAEPGVAARRLAALLTGGMEG
ncbi:MAG: hypothetical protein HQL97_11230 [Magnetococcales bacterium]|nr:hypothetical protein [Magnetococcales bacterium]MBF0262389.1 hypothetical protein [Magnetococcales bacterium]